LKSINVQNSHKKSVDFVQKNNNLIKIVNGVSRKSNQIAHLLSIHSKQHKKTPSEVKRVTAGQSCDR